MKPALVDMYLRTRALDRGLRGLSRRILGRKRTIYFYYCVTDPYSHLLGQALSRTDWDPSIRLEIRIVPEPGADANPEPTLQAEWARRDARRLARFFGLSLPETAKAASDERVRRANAVLLKERAPDEQLKVLERVGRALHAGDPHGLSAAVERYGVVAGHAVRPALERNYAALRKHGHYQSGVCHYQGEWYVGLDRYDYLVERLRSEGVSVASMTYRRPANAAAAADELFFSFRSPYSYLALEQIRSWREPPRLRPVLPMVARGLEVPQSKVRYLLRDAKREADRLGIELGKVVDPLGVGVENALAMFEAAANHGREFDFAQLAMRAAWAEGRDLADEGVVRALGAQVGLEPVEMDAALASGEWRARADANRDRLIGAGLWGVPTFVRNGKALWGQDRIAWLDRDEAES